MMHGLQINVLVDKTCQKDDKILENQILKITYLKLKANLQVPAPKM